MGRWELAVALDPSAETPVFLQIARSLVEDVRRGRLRPGDALPGSRSLASSLRVHRNTVLAAYQELEAEGWIVMRQAKGTFVSEDLPERAPRRFSPGQAQRSGVPARLGFELRPTQVRPYRVTVPKGVLSLGGGVPDLRLVPAAELARAYRRALKRHGRTVLDYGEPHGHLRLRTAVAAMLSSRRGLAARPENVLITRGSQMALDLLARTLLAPGDAVAVEALGYRPAWEVLQLAGGKLFPVPVDANGLDVGALARLASHQRLRAVYLTPHHQYPTTAVLSPGRRLELLELARRERWVLIEDDYDHEFHYEGRPVLPLASADTAGVVLYIGTLSKILAPGLRLGFLVAPSPLIERAALVRGLVDRHGDQAVECAVAELLEDGEVQRHARRMRRIYSSRRLALANALQKHLGKTLSFELPAGGISLWANVDPSVDVDAWAERALARGVAFFPARRFSFTNESLPAARLGFAALDEHEIVEAVRRMAQSLKA
jgi:GntR family transcriptional regulator/MocR family aminotransferase